MDRFGFCAVILCLFFAAGVHSQLVCYRCNDCSASPLEATVCGGSGSWGDTGPTLPTSPAPTAATSTTTNWWLTTYGPTIATIPPWPRSARAYGYLCYRVERYIPSQGRYVLDRGCALQLATYETTCHSVTGQQGYRNCQFCTSSLCNM